MNLYEEVDLIISENFDLNDKYTLDVLTHINEADTNDVVTSLTNKLYNAIIDKIADIDFGNIPVSKGDITKIQNYDQLVDCINVIKELVAHYGQPTGSIDIVSDAIENIKDRTAMFEKMFLMGIDFGITTYNTMVLACVSSVSFLISSSIEYIKRPDSTFEIALDKVAYIKTKDALLFKNLNHFNKSCDNGDIDKSLDYLVETHKKNFVGGLTIGVFSAVVIIRALIPLVQELVYFFFLFRQELSDYFAAEADLLLMNAANIESLTNDETDLSKEDRKKIGQKQKKIADKFRKWSNFFNVELKKAEKKASQDVMKDVKSYKIDDVMDTKPDSYNPSSTDGGLF